MIDLFNKYEIFSFLRDFCAPPVSGPVTLGLGCCLTKHPRRAWRMDRPSLGWRDFLLRENYISISSFGLLGAQFRHPYKSYATMLPIMFIYLFKEGLKEVLNRDLILPINDSLLNGCTLRKLVFHFLSHWMGYDREDSFPFDFEPNGFPFGSESKGKLFPRLYPIQFERKWNTSFLSVRIVLQFGLGRILALYILVNLVDIKLEFFHTWYRSILNNKEDGVVVNVYV